MATAIGQPFIAARTTPERKAQFAALAASRGMSESALLTLLMDTVLEGNSVVDSAADSDEDSRASERVSLRLRQGDRRRVNARAAARNMKPASYVVALIRAHVRHEAPLPVAELNVLKVAVAQLSAVARHLHQLASGDAGTALDVEFARHLHETVARVEDVRRYVSDVVRGNLMSWEAGDA